ncbi:4501_t:CDS:2, partial [Funneliformis mosseae]
MSSIVINEENIIYEKDLNMELNNITLDLEEDTEIYITKQITIKTVLHSLTPIEYPLTSKDGVVIVYYIEGWQDIQYPIGEPFGQNLTTCSYLSDVIVNKKDRIYHRFKICEFASSKLREIEYESIDPDSDLCLKVNEELSTIQTECRYNKDNIKCTRRPVLKCLKCRNKTISPSYFISCDRWNFNKKFYQYISIKENIDLNLLQQLLNGLYEDEIDKP